MCISSRCCYSQAFKVSSWNAGNGYDKTNANVDADDRLTCKNHKSTHWHNAYAWIWKWCLGDTGHLQIVRKLNVHALLKVFCVLRPLSRKVTAGYLNY